MNKQLITTIVAVLALLLGSVGLIHVLTPAPIVLGPQGVTNFSSIHLSDLPEGTATPVFIVDEQSGGSANVVEFRVASTPVWSMNSSGGTTQSGTDTRTGNLDLNGNDLIIDTDGDSVLDENTDDAIRMTLGAATGTFSVLTGNFKVGNGSPSTAQDAEDAYVEGGFEVDGTTRLDGALNANSTATITGAVTAGAGVTISNGNARVNDFVILDQAAALDVVSDAIITPTGTYQQLSSAGATTPTVTTSGIQTGTLLILVNTSDVNVLIQNSGTMKLDVTGTDITLDQFDTLGLLFDGTNWLEIR